MRILAPKRPQFVHSHTPSSGLLQRQCACGQHTTGEDECEQCRQQRAGTLQRASMLPTVTNAVPPIVYDVLSAPGQPLDTEARTFMEPRFGHDFSKVRVHADERAVESTQAVNALAYTVGPHLVFDRGQYAPAATSGKKLLAHELTHVVQQAGQTSLMPMRMDGGASDPLEQAAENFAEYVVSGEELSADMYGMIGTSKRGMVPIFGQTHSTVQRQENMSVAQDTQTTQDVQTILTVNPERQARLDQLLAQINTLTQESLDLRVKLDALDPASSEERTSVETDLDNHRATLIPVLEQRVTLLDDEIAALIAAAGPNPSSSAEHPQTDLLRRDAERRQHQNQLRPLQRWQTRKEISAIDAQIADIDSQLATLPPVSTPVTDNLFLQRADLERQKEELAAALTSTATEYKQFDSRWGATRYGQSSKCTNIQEAGCGPTSLAILLNYLYQEDPESLAASGQMEIVTPQETAPYAATHGRVCNSGTVGDTMVTSVGTTWPGFRGRKIELSEATAQLHEGNLVIFLCKGCTGQNRSGGDKHYGGHFMVLNGVSDDGQTFNVLDPGANEAKDIETISQQELSAHAKGFWTVEQK